MGKGQGGHNCGIPMVVLRGILNNRVIVSEYKVYS